MGTLAGGGLGEVLEFLEWRVGCPGSCASGSSTERCPRPGLLTTSVKLPPQLLSSWELLAFSGLVPQMTEEDSGGLGERTFPGHPMRQRARQRENPEVEWQDWGQWGQGTQGPQGAATRDSVKYQLVLLLLVLMMVCVGSAGGAGRTRTSGLVLIPEPPERFLSCTSTPPISFKNVHMIWRLDVSAG